MSKVFRSYEKIVMVMMIISSLLGISSMLHYKLCFGIASSSLSLSLVFLILLCLLHRQHEQSERTSVRPEEGGSSHAASDEENDMFWGLDDIAGSHYCLILYGGIIVQSSSTEINLLCS